MNAFPTGRQRKVGGAFFYCHSEWNIARCGIEESVSLGLRTLRRGFALLGMTGFLEGCEARVNDGWGKTFSLSAELRISVKRISLISQLRWQLLPGEAFIAKILLLCYNTQNTGVERHIGRSCGRILWLKFFSFAMAKSCRISKSACASKEIPILKLHLPTVYQRKRRAKLAKINKHLTRLILP